MPSPIEELKRKLGTPSVDAKNVVANLKSMPPEAKSALAELARRERCRRSLIEFAKRMLPSYKDNWHHRLIAEKLEEVDRGLCRRLIIAMPPRAGKSELVSAMFPSWYLGRHPEREVMLTSYSTDLASSFGRRTRNIVVSEEFTSVFGRIMAEDSQSANKWHTVANGGLIALGVGAGATGRGASCLIIDDPIKNREEAESLTMRSRAYDWFTSTAYTRLSPAGAIVLVATRWHEDDLTGRLLEQMKAGGEKWEVLSFPAIAETDEEHRRQGEALWPERYGLEDYKRTRDTIGPYDWSALYQQSPIDSASQEFRPEMFKTRPYSEVEAMMTNRFLSIDTAISQAASADYTGFCENMVDQQNNWNLRAWHERMTPLELIDRLFALHATRRYTKIGIEKGIYAMTLKPFLDDEMKRRNVFLPIFELDHRQQGKELRIRGLLPRYAAGAVYHVEGECAALEDELLRFPKGRHDDVADAAAYQNQLAEAPFGVGGGSQEFGMYASSYR